LQRQRHFEGKAVRRQSSSKAKQFEGKGKKAVRRQSVNCTTVTTNILFPHKQSNLGTAGSEDDALPESVGRRMLQR
jgi:hypothetical protein